MKTSPKLVKSIILILCSLAVTASTATAGGTRYFKDQNQRGYRIVIHATPNRVLSGIFIASGKRTLKCDDGAVFVGGFPIKNAKITNGRFHAVAMGYFGEGGSWRLMFRGALKGDTIRGAVSLHFVYLDPEGSRECWSGKSKRDALVHYLARAGR